MSDDAGRDKPTPLGFSDLRDLLGRPTDTTTADVDKPPAPTHFYVGPDGRYPGAGGVPPGVIIVPPPRAMLTPEEAATAKRIDEIRAKAWDAAAEAMRRVIAVETAAFRAEPGRKVLESRPPTKRGRRPETYVHAAKASPVHAQLLEKIITCASGEGDDPYNAIGRFILALSKQQAATRRLLAKDPWSLIRSNDPDVLTKRLRRLYRLREHRRLSLAASMGESLPDSD